MVGEEHDRRGRPCGTPWKTFLGRRGDGAGGAKRAVTVRVGDDRRERNRLAHLDRSNQAWHILGPSRHRKTGLEWPF